MLNENLGMNASVRSDLETIAPAESSPDKLKKKRRAAGLTLGSKSTWWALLGSLTLAAFYGRVALLNLTTGLVGGDLDAYENLWNNSWIKTALFNFRNPFYTDYIYYPTGISLRFHTLNPFNGLLTLPFNLTLGWVPTTNLLFVMALAFTTFFGFLLIRDLVGNTWAAFAGAALFTYANHMVVGFFSFGQAEKLSAEWYPLYLFFMFRALHGKPARQLSPLRVQTFATKVQGSKFKVQGSKLENNEAGISGEQTVLRDLSPQNSKSLASEGIRVQNSKSPALDGVKIQNLKYTGLSILTLIILSLTDWQYLIYAVFTTLLYFGFLLFTRRSWAEKRTIFFKLVAIGGIYAAVVAVPLVLPMIKEAAESPWLSVSDQSVYHSRDLLDFIRPGLENPGYLALAAGLFGLVWAWRNRGREREIALFWALAATFASIMALGPKLIVNEQVTDLPMPYNLLYKLPVLSTGRDPERFYTIAMLGFGILTAFGLRYLFDWLRMVQFRPALARFFEWHQSLVACLVVIFLAVSLGGFVVEAGKAPVYSAVWPPFYEQLAKDKETYAILELPLFADPYGRGEDTYEAFQAIHQKKRFSGRLARDHKLTNPNNFVKKASLFRDLWLIKPDDQKRLYPEQDFLTRTDYQTQGPAILNYYDVRYIVIYKDALQDAIKAGQQPRFDSILGQVLGKAALAKPYYDDSIMTVYKVPAAPPPANPLTLDIGNGWSTAQSDDKVVYRWADNTDNQPSEFYTMNLTQQPVRATFSFQSIAFKQPRTLKVLINGYEAGTYQLKPDELKPISLDLTIPPGNNTITLVTPEPPLPTDDPKKDARLLTFQAREVSLKAK